MILSQNWNWPIKVRDSGTWECVSDFLLVFFFQTCSFSIWHLCFNKKIVHKQKCTCLRVLCLKTIYVDTCMALIRKRQLDHKWKRRLQFGNITQLSCLGGTLQCSPESRASNWHIVYTSIYTGVQSIAISVSMHRMHNMPEVAVASSGVTDGGCAGRVLGQ